MAVLVSYANDGIDLSAIYYYCRSVLVAHPFVTGIDNLKIALDKNTSRFLRKSIQPDRDTDNMKSSIHGNRKGSDSSAVNEFLMRFLFICNLIFNLSEKIYTLKSSMSTNLMSESNSSFDIYGQEHVLMVQNKIQKDIESEVSNTNVLVLHHIQLLLNELDQAIMNPLLTDEIFIQVIVVVIFHIHFTRDKVLALSNKSFVENSPMSLHLLHLYGKQKDIKDSNDYALSDSPRTSVESLALLLLYSLINR